MFRCELCKNVAPPSTPATRIIVKTRQVEYPFRKDANRFRQKGRVKIVDDPGGSGMEIVKELLVCPDCARQYK